MKRKKERYKNTIYKRDSFLTKFMDIIKTNKNSLPKFNKCNLYNQEIIDTNSWFDITKITNKTKRYPVIKSIDKLDKCEYKQIKIKMILTDIHKQIFQNGGGDFVI